MCISKHDMENRCLYSIYSILWTRLDAIRADVALGRSNNETSGKNKSRDLSQKFLFWGRLDEH